LSPRLFAAASTTVVTFVASAAVAVAAPPPGVPVGPPLVTPRLDPASPALPNAASVVHCNAIEGGSGVIVVNKNHDDLGTCSLG
jgi:hypothetical protein